MKRVNEMSYQTSKMSEQLKADMGLELTDYKEFPALDDLRLLGVMFVMVLSVAALLAAAGVGIAIWWAF